MQRFLRRPWRWAVAWWASLLLVVFSLALAPGTVQGQARGTVKRFAITYNTSGDKTLVAGVAGQLIRVYQLFLVCNGANNLILKDSTPTTLQPIINLAAGGAWVLDQHQDVPWYETAAGKDLVLNLSASQQCSGVLYYTQG